MDQQAGIFLNTEVLSQFRLQVKGSLGLTDNNASLAILYIFMEFIIF